MKEYPKINTLWKRDMANGGRILEGQWSTPEFEYLQHAEWEFTEKVDGTNIRIALVPECDKLVVAARTDTGYVPAPLEEAVRKLISPEKFDEAFTECIPGDVVLYGEGYGPKIQNGGKYRKDPGFVLFDIRVGNWWLKREDIEAVAEKLGVEAAPIVGRGTLHEAVAMVRGGLRSAWGNFRAEGLVVRPLCELRTRANHRVIGKLKDRDFATAS